MIRLTSNDLYQTFLKEYELDKNYWFSDTIRKDDCIFAWHDKLTETWWNHAAKLDNENVDIEKLINDVIMFYKQKNRVPAFLLTPFSKPTNLANILKQKGFIEAEGSDVWMFYESEDTPEFSLRSDLTIEHVSTEQNIETFVDLFNNVHTNGGPDEPYGELPKDYGEVLRYFLQHTPTDRKVFNYLASKDSFPAGYATCIGSGKFAGIYNVGTLREYRKQGIATTLTYQAITDAKKSGAEAIFLITEKDSYNEKFYAKIGFSSKFNTKAYILQ